jgi:hypothetical protein
MIVSLHSINQQFFLLEMHFIFCEVGIEVLDVMYVNFMLQMVLLIMVNVTGWLWRL